MAELTDAQKVLRNDTGKRIAEAIEALGGTPPINLGMTGASVGQVPVINTVDANGAPTSYRPGAGGGSGGTSDYNDLSNKPSINDVALSGNKTAAQLGLGTYSKPSGGIPQTDLAQTVQNKLDNTVVVSDTQPTATENKLWVDTDAGTGSTYQVPTVAEMAAADAQVAAEIGSQIADSGWRYPTFNTGWSNYGTDDPAIKYRKVGKMVEVSGCIKPDGEKAVGEHTVFTLPSGYRPSSSVYTVCCGSNINKILTRVDTYGNLKVSRYGATSITAIPSGAWLAIHMTYLVG